MMTATRENCVRVTIGGYQKKTKSATQRLDMHNASDCLREMWSPDERI